MNSEIKDHEHPSDIPDFVVEPFLRVLNSHDVLVREVSDPSMLTLVATDLIGEQALTLELYRLFAPRLQELIKAGVDLIVPLPAGNIPSVDACRQIIDILGTSAIRIGIPSKKAAWSAEQLHDFLENCPVVSRIHLLGMSPANRGYAERVAVARTLRPDLDISADANRLLAVIGRSGPVGKAIHDRVSWDYEWKTSTQYFWYTFSLAATTENEMIEFGNIFDLDLEQMHNLMALHQSGADNNAFFQYLTEACYAGIPGTVYLLSI